MVVIAAVMLAETVETAGTRAWAAAAAAAVEKEGGAGRGARVAEGGQKAWEDLVVVRMATVVADLASARAVEGSVVALAGRAGGGTAARAAAAAAAVAAAAELGVLMAGLDLGVARVAVLVEAAAAARQQPGAQ